MDCKITFTVHTDASDKQLGAVISRKPPIDFFSRRLDITNKTKLKQKRNLY